MTMVNSGLKRLIQSDLLCMKLTFKCQNLLILTKIKQIHFLTLEVVGRGSETQLQVSAILNDLI